MRAKICRKEVKESRLFLRLIEVGTSNISSRDALAVEAYELTLIFPPSFRKAADHEFPFGF